MQIGDRVVGDELQLVLLEEVPGDRAMNHVPVYKFRMTLVGQDEEIGRIQLRIGNTRHIVMYAGHIGYSVHPPHRGHRYAAKACRLLFPLARSHGLTELWITCSPDNTASRRTCELAGGKLVGIVDLPEDTDMFRKGERRKYRYRIDL